MATSVFDVYAFISRHIAETNVAPSLREIGANFGISAPAASKHVNTLSNEGLISHTPDIARGISIPTNTDSIVVPVCKWQQNDASWGGIIDVIRIQEAQIPSKESIVVATYSERDYPNAAIIEGDLLLIMTGENIPGKTIILFNGEKGEKTIQTRESLQRSSHLQLGTVLMVIRHVNHNRC